MTPVAYRTCADGLAVRHRGPTAGRRRSGVGLAARWGRPPEARAVQPQLWTESSDQTCIEGLFFP